MSSTNEVIGNAPGDEQRIDVVILGAGVLGLTIAHELLAAGIKPAIVGRDLPEDSDSAAFASPWAGANWSAMARPDDPAQIRRETVTYHKWEQLADQIPELVTRMEFHHLAKSEEGLAEDQRWYRNLVGNYRRLEASELMGGYTHGLSFRSFTINSPLYLRHLSSLLRSLGVPIIRHRVSSLDEAYTLPSLPNPVKLIINATGLGARSLLGVEDPCVYPVRGQTVLVRAPHVPHGWGVRDPGTYQPDGKRTYIIPRPGPAGHVILGGTYLENEWCTLPDMAMAERILRDTYALCPELAAGNANGGGEGWEGIEVVGHNVGLRPCRKGGVRIEVERRRLGEGTGKKGLLPGWMRGTGREGEEVGVVHAYGIGPAGYQTSWGIAQEVTGLVQQYYQNHPDARA